MSEPETDSGRQPVSPDAEPSHPTAEPFGAERGQPDSSPTGTGSEAPMAGFDVPVSASGTAATTGFDVASAGISAPSDGDGAPVVSMPAAPVGGSAPTIPQQSVVPVSAPGPLPPNPWQPHVAQQNQPGWTGSPGYPGSGLPPYPPSAPPYPPSAPPYPPSAPPYPPSAPAYQPVGGPLPGWAPGPIAAVPVAKPSRLGRIAAVGAAALVLMTGSGIAGGLATLAFTDDSSSTGKTYTAAPILSPADLPGIAAAVENSVVSITTGSGEGSGVVLTADGYVLTNNHVVASASGETVSVVLADGKTALAKIVGTDPRTDLAVVKAEGASGLSPAKLGDSDAMRVGDTVLALGSPLGLQGSVTAGIISARDRTIQASESGRQSGASSISGLLQTDAPINPGNSGGALVNTRGEVIGINTAIATAGQGNGNIGVGFAIPSNKAETVAAALMKGEKVSHPHLGVSVGLAEGGGAAVNSVTPGSPADKAGLRSGDVITRFGTKVINDQEDLVAAVQGGRVGDQVELTYTRDGAESKATVTLAETS